MCGVANQYILLGASGNLWRACLSMESMNNMPTVTGFI